MKFVIIFETVIKGLATLAPFIVKLVKRKKPWPIVKEEAPQEGAVEPENNPSIQ